jgi:hypothetical protein
MWVLTAGWVKKSSSAARLKWPILAKVIKVFKWWRSIYSLLNKKDLLAHYNY